MPGCTDAQLVVEHDDYSDAYVMGGEVVRYTSDELLAKNSLAHGWIWKMPERIAVDTRSLSTAQAQAWVRIKAARAAAQASDFTCDGATYQANSSLPSEGLAALVARMTAAPYTKTWRLADNTTKTLDAAGMIAVCAAQTQHLNDAFNIGEGLRAQIDAAATNAAADAVKWPPT